MSNKTKIHKQPNITNEMIPEPEVMSSNRKRKRQLQCHFEKKFKPF